MVSGNSTPLVTESGVPKINTALGQHSRGTADRLHGEEIVTTLPDGRRDCLVEQGQVVLRDVDELEIGILACSRYVINPVRDCVVERTCVRTSHHDCDSEHVFTLKLPTR